MNQKISNTTLIFMLLAAGFIANVGESRAQEPIPTIEANVTMDWAAALDLGSDYSTARLEVYAEGDSEFKCAGDFDQIPGEDPWLDCWEVGINPGDEIYLYLDGLEVKTHTVFDLFITGFDFEDDFLTGSGPAYEAGWVYVCNPDEICYSADFEASAEGEWSVYLGPDLIDPEAWFSAFMADEDQDRTMAEIPPPVEQPAIEAGVPSWVSAWGFGPDVFAARLEVYQADGITLKCEGDFDPTAEDVWLDCWEVGVFPGDIIYLFTNDELEPIKEHVVFDITMDAADLATGYFAGTGPAGSTVRVDVCPPEEDCISREIFLDGTPFWEISFNLGSFDPDSWFGAFMVDDDGDQTMVGLSPQPVIDYSLSYNWLGISFFPPGSELFVEIYSDPSLSELITTETLFTDQMGFAGWDTLLYLGPGNFIRVSSGDGEIVKELILEALSLEVVDFELDQVGGYAAPGAQIYFVIDGGGDDWFEIGWVAGPDGWFIDLGADFGIDLREDKSFWVYAIDEDGDQTKVDWTGLQDLPFINAYPQFELINGVGWPMGDEVTLVIDDDLNPDTGNLYFSTGVSESAPWEPLESFVSFDLRPFDLQAGHYIIMFNADLAQVHQVTNLVLSAVDDVLDTAAGTADPGSDVLVVVNWEHGTDNNVTADGSGNWVADYTGQYDLGYGDLVTAMQSDDGGNSTFSERLIVTPGGLVDEIQNMPEDLVAPEIKNSLIKKVENAYSSYLKGNLNAAVNKLEALLHEIDALAGNKISEDVVHRLNSLVMNLIKNFEG